MFLRNNAYILNSIRSEGRKFGVRYTAQSKKKRVTVQLLRDFPSIGVKGQIVHVKASTMINKLHRGNGAIYLNFKGAQPKIAVVDPKEIQAIKDKEREKATTTVDSKVEEPVVEEPAKPLEAEKKPEKLLSLDELIGLDLAEVTEEDKRMIIDAIPKKITFKRYSKDDILDSALTLPKITASLEDIMRKSLRNKKFQDVVSQFFVQKKITLVLKPVGLEDDKIDVADALKHIQKIGNYALSVQENGKPVAQISIHVVAREN